MKISKVCTPFSSFCPMPVAAAAASVVVVASVLAVVLESVEVAHRSSVGGSSGRGVGSGGSKGGSINNSNEGRGSVVVVVVVADPPPDLDSDSDSDDKFYDALSNSHCVKCQIEYLGSHFDHCDLDLESGQSSDDSKVGWRWPWPICWTKHCQQNLQSLVNKEIPIHHQTQLQKLYKDYEFIYEVLSYSHS